LRDVAVSERHAAELSEFSVRRLRAWDARGPVGPSIKRRLSGRNIVRLHTFDDLVELLVASALVDAGSPPRQIRRAVEHLRERDHAAPLRELRFAVSSDRIYF
jgi:DNA-binding transcriptional MerR regulator